MLALLLVIPAMGAVLGLRFKVVVLAPAMLLISAVTVAFGIASSQGVVISEIAANLSLQEVPKSGTP